MQEVPEAINVDDAKNTKVIWRHLAKLEQLWARIVPKRHTMAGIMFEKEAVSN